jgi:hypothetical protein
MRPVRRRARSVFGIMKEKPYGKNLAKISQDEMDKVNVDLAAAGVAFKERYNMPVVADLVERSNRHICATGSVNA